jgi:hypothetical protein
MDIGNKPAFGAVRTKLIIAKLHQNADKVIRTICVHLKRGDKVKEYLEQHANAFDSDEVLILTAALDQAWATVQASGASFDGDDDAQSARSLLAKNIVEAALRGELNVRRLYEGALARFTARRVHQYQPGAE